MKSEVDTSLDLNPISSTFELTGLGQVSNRLYASLFLFLQQLSMRFFLSLYSCQHWSLASPVFAFL